MIKDNITKYTVSSKWILRKDNHYHTKYTLYNVESRIIMNISPALYYIIKILYYNSLSMCELSNYLNKNGIAFDFSLLNDIMIKHNAKDLFVESNVSLHKPQYDYNQKINQNELVPISTTPFDVELHFTHSCNLCCTHCFQNSSRNSDKSIHLNPEKWIEIFMQFEELNMHNVIISGGEPMFYEGFEKVMTRAVNLRLSYVILTNGMLITSQNIHLFKHKNVQLTISVDGHTSEIHEKIRGKNTFDKLDKILDLLVDNNININIAHTVNKINQSYIEDFIQYIKSKRIRSISFGIIEPTGRANLNKMLLLMKNEEKMVYEKFCFLEKKYQNELSINFPNLSYVQDAPDYSSNNIIYCSAGTKRIAINSAGELYPCIKAFSYDELKIGDLKNTNIIDLWLDSAKWTNYRGAISIDQVFQCCSCVLKNSCALRNCRLGSYSKEFGLFGKPYNCLIDKL